MFGGGQNKRRSLYTGVAVGYYGQISGRRMGTGEKGIDSVKYELQDGKGDAVTNTAFKSLKDKEDKDTATKDWKYVKVSEASKDIQTNDAVNSFILGIDLFYNYKITDNWSLKIGGRVSYIRTHYTVWKDKEQKTEFEESYDYIYKKDGENLTKHSVENNVTNVSESHSILHGISIVPTISVSYTF